MERPRDPLLVLVLAVLVEVGLQAEGDVQIALGADGDDRVEVVAQGLAHHVTAGLGSSGVSAVGGVCTLILLVSRVCR